MVLRKLSINNYNKANGHYLHLVLSSYSIVKLPSNQDRWYIASRGFNNSFMSVKEHIESIK